MRILLTGATGYVGSAVATRLLERGHEVTAVVRAGRTATPSPRRGLSWVTAELDAPDVIARLAREHDGIAHLAAGATPEFDALNHRLIDRFMMTLGPEQSFLMQAGSLVFGDSGDGAFDDDTAYATPPALGARAALERSVLDHGKRKDGPRSFVCYAAFVYGGAGGAVPGMLLAAAARSGISMHVGDGSQAWSPVHVVDWAGLMVECLERGPRGGRRVFAADADALPMKEIAGVIGDHLGVPTGRISLGEAIERFGPFGPALGVAQRLARTGLVVDLDWRARQPDFADWLRAFGSAR